MNVSRSSLASFFVFVLSDAFSLRPGVRYYFGESRARALMHAVCRAQ